MSIFKLILLIFILCTSVDRLQASEPSQVDAQKIKNLYLRLTGTPPNKEKLDELKFRARNETLDQLASYIISTQPEFYDVTLKNFVTPFSNLTSDHTTSLNDMTATMIGFVRDDIPFNQIFYKNSFYFFDGEAIGDNLTPVLTTLLSPTKLTALTGATASTVNSQIDLVSTPQDRLDRLKAMYPTNDKIIVKDPRYDDVIYVLSRFVNDRNTHYEDAESLSLSFTSPAFKQSSQTGYLHPTSYPTAGIMSTRGFGKAYLLAGTNRAAVSYVIDHFMCNSMTQLKDSTLSDQFVTKDIPRIPGGSEKTYKNDCVSCHTGLDPMTNAFAHYDFVGDRLVYDPSRPALKLNRNIANDDESIGNAVEDEYWINFWKTGPSSRLNWGPVSEGYGVKSLGKMYAATGAFPVCMSKRVLEKVCFNRTRSATPKEDAIIESLSESFVASNFNMKKLFIDVALTCEDAK